jgi:hypothetical protein
MTFSDPAISHLARAMALAHWRGPNTKGSRAEERE